ncbi:MFS transporter [Paenibacillus albus]|uniref:MFS transporter n=1 Tax=Paenibacillus albus TaxID=2495582 RepID=A0A3S9ADZ8_9BACL|nr:MFS transporter [Paenibacillus albus]
MKSIRVLRQERQYSRLFWSGLINGIGDRFSQVAILSLLLSLTGSGAAVGITFAVRLIPYFVFGPLGGFIADRFSKRNMMIITDLVRVWFALIPLFVHDASDVWMIYVSSFLLSAGEALYAPARMSAIPQIVQKDNLLSINGLEQVMLGIVLIGGSVTGSVVSATVGVHASFVLNALSFLLSALFLAQIKIPMPTAKSTAQQPKTGSVRLGSLNELRKLIPESPFTRMMLLVFLVTPIGDGIFNILLSVYAVEVFEMGDIGIGVMYGALGFGLVFGSGILGRFAGHMRIAVVSLLLVEGSINMIISQSSSFVIVAILLILTASCGSIGNACKRTILMKEVPAHLQGQFFGMLATFQNTIMGTSMFAAGFLLEIIAPRTVGFAGGTLLVVIGTAFASMLLWKSSKKTIT